MIIAISGKAGSGKSTTAKEVAKRAKQIGLGALKFFILKYDAASDFIFKPAESISFEGETGPYELLSKFTRGRAVTAAGLREFIDGLKLKSAVKEELRRLSPLNYTGLSAKLAGTVSKR